MPIHYRRDDTQRWIVAIGEGTFSAEDFLTIFAQMRADGIWSYGRLYDLRRMSGSATLGDLTRFMEAASQPGTSGERVGPTAVVVTDPRLYAKACAYKSLGPPGRYDVFSNRIEAEAWLAAASPQR
jgi:hypothetical protein